MRLTICRLKFQDGVEVVARLEEVSRQVSEDVSYSGAIERLPAPLRKSCAGVLIRYFERIAKDLNAELSIDESGKYERWAE
jgi:hypothetical protein